MTDNERIVREFIASWSSLDAGRIAAYFAEDGIYHNMPIDAVSGRAAIEQFIGFFAGSWTSTEWEVLNVACAGNVVIAERVDRIRAGERCAELPCVGVFELEAGKITAWRDYFDLATYQRGLG